MKQLVIFILLIPITLVAQTGGKNAFPFLDLPYDARTGSLGRKLITIFDDDLHMGIQNPAALNPSMDNSVGISQALLASGINHGMLAYAKDFANIGTGAIHLRYVAYGKMNRMDEFGQELGTFSAGDFVLGASMGRIINSNLSIGASFNIIWSQLESYGSFGISADIAGMYRSTDERTVVTAVVRNIGAQIKSYLPKQRAPLAIEPMIGFSHRLGHAPFRFSIIAQRLNKWDLSYNDPKAMPTLDPLTGAIIPVKRAGFGEKLGRHFIFQVESLIGKIVRIRVAFDYNQRMEMLVQNRPGIGGFSFGAGLNFKRFAIDYGFYAYSTAGYHNLLTIRGNINTWRKGAK
ncbi:MAG: type IX secretion system protein PorQ [Brumimicrobium sp.]|nr:type IX secretion system protein PorQ [Brumimicrobium sp.]MCO5268261.1 type IX secretion system protein PorQ [Brumimicrobium sp.]